MSKSNEVQDLLLLLLLLLLWIFFGSHVFWLFNPPFRLQTQRGFNETIKLQTDVLFFIFSFFLGLFGIFSVDL